MPYLIVNNPLGRQELVEVGESGTYFDLSRVIWDERADGLLSPEQISQVGGFARVGGSLVFDAAQFAANPSVSVPAPDKTVAQQIQELFWNKNDPEVLVMRAIARQLNVLANALRSMQGLPTIPFEQAANAAIAAEMEL